MPAILRSPWRSFLLVPVVGVLSAALTAVAWAEAAPAKQYTTWFGKFPEPVGWRSKRTTITETGEAPDEESAKLFDTHCKFAVAELTKPNNDARHSDKRRELKKELNFLGTKPKLTLHDTLLKTLEMALPKVFNNEDFFPAARVNCLLLYSDLNSKEGDIAGKGAIPLASALPVLVQIVKNPDGKYPLILQDTALAGVERHAGISATADLRRDLTQTMVGWMRNPPGKNVSPDVQNFLRRRAADVLRLLAAKGPEANTAEVAAALQQFAVDEDVPLDDRCETVRTLGLIDSKSLGEKNVPVIARTIALLAADVGRQAATADATLATELEAPADEPKKEEGDADEANAEMEEPVAKSKLALPPDWQAYFLTCLRLGLEGPESPRGRGLSGAATGESKQMVADLGTKIGAMIDVVKRKKKEDRLNDDELKKMQDLAASLEEIVGNKPGQPEGAIEQARVPN